MSHKLRAAATPCCRPLQVEQLNAGVDLASIVEKMEIIEPQDIQLIRFLGSGGCVGGSSSRVARGEE